MCSCFISPNCVHVHNVRAQVSDWWPMYEVSSLATSTSVTMGQGAPNQPILVGDSSPSVIIKCCRAQPSTQCLTLALFIKERPSHEVTPDDDDQLTLLDYFYAGTHGLST